MTGQNPRHSIQLMNTNPLNLFVRFLLEIAMLIIFGYWEFHRNVHWERWAGAIGLPLAAAALWGIFRIPDDPKPAPIEVPGIVRLLLEWVLFGSAIWALQDLKQIQLSLVMAIIILLHYIVSYDRTWAMLRNRKYKGFLKTPD